ncbi:hemerythrin superfamily protein [Prauserella isguenensis]|uniref:Hemerythrin superfamily protein n=2 Tax=Prauserella isguenensis TaxID=1470180 RepID=A0A839RXE8_9PSEU|nr:hemerythrin superfamily protein [Prauserella isguenensis]
MSMIDLGRPSHGDVVDLIIDDHRRFEQLLRQLRMGDGNRDELRRAFAAVHVAHSIAEEEIVYPVLRRKADDIGQHEVEHGEEEHAEGNEALLRVLDLKGTDTPTFVEAVEKLSNLVAHHLAEEELSILAAARTEVAERTRHDLGEKWAARRTELLDQDCGDVEYVRRIVEQARREGHLDD